MVSRYVSNFTLGIGPNPSGHPPPHVTPMPLGVAMAATAAAAAAAAAVPPSTQQQGQGQQQQQTSQTLKGPNPTEYHVQQCLMQGPSGPPQAQHQHYRILHSRSDGYVASQSGPVGFSASQSGPPHQGPAVLRGMPSTAPPTPPQQQDLSKMQQQQQSIYVPPTGSSNTSGNVRPNQQTNLYRGTGSSAAPRGRHNITTMQQPPIYSTPLPSYVPLPYTYQPRQQHSQMYQSGPPFHFSGPQMQTGYPAYNYTFFTNSVMSSQHRPNASMMQAPTSQAIAGANQAPMSAMSSIITSQTGTATSAGTGGEVRKNRKHAVPIIDPETNKDVIEAYEASKSQSATTTEIDYNNDQINAVSGDVLAASSSQNQDQIELSDPNCSNKTLQGMSFGGEILTHKLGAIPQVNEIIGPTTPIVSAMTDAPSVEIHHPKPKPKKNKSIEIVAPPPPAPVEKVIEIKNQAHEVAGISEENIECTTNNAASAGVTCSSNVKTVEEVTVVEKRDSEYTNHTVTENIETINTGKGLNKTQSSNQQQQQQQVSITAASSSLSTISSPTTSSSILSSSPGATAASAVIQHPPLQAQTISQQNQLTTSTKQQPHRDNNHTKSLPATTATLPSPQSTANQNTVSTANVSYNNNNISNQGNKQALASAVAASAATASTVAGLSGTTTNQTTSTSSNINTSTTTGGSSGKVNKIKDKNIQQQQQHQQRQQPSSNNNINNNNNNSQSNISETLSQENKAQSTSSNNNLNQQSQQQTQQQYHHHQSQHHRQTEKMKLNDRDDNKTNKTSAATNNSSTSNHNNTSIDKKETTTNLNNKKLSDKNENIIPCKNYPISINDNLTECSSTVETMPQQQPQHQLPQQSQQQTIPGSSISSSNSDNSVSNSLLDSPTISIPTTTVSSPINTSHDETDKASTMADDNVNYYNNNNNNDKLVATNQESGVTTLVTDDDNGTSTPPAAGAGATTPATSIENNKSNDNNDGDGATAITNGKPATGNVMPEIKTLIKYNKDQWSPSNLDGSKIYDRTQLLSLKEAHYSKVKPVLKNRVSAILLLEKRSPHPSLMPAFAKNSSNKRQAMGSGNLSMGGSMSGASSSNPFLKQASMSGVNAKNSSKGSKSGMIHVSLSLGEDVKLNESENAWRPTHLKHNANQPPDVIEKEELYRNVRGILNKLTPEKFDTLSEQIMKLRIDTPEKVKGVMELVFEKAVDEPNFSVSYARLCERLGAIKIPSEESQNNKKNFKSALIDKTEHEFGQNVLSSEAKENKLQPILEKIKECTNNDRKLELQTSYEEEERKIRRRSGGTVRFIGELFKISMLTSKIMNDCINNLLDPQSEDKLECLCKLLTTIGQQFEKNQQNPKDSSHYNLHPTIEKMQLIADRKIGTKISSRVRFMLQDVIDLRKNKWESSRNDLNPKTMEQIQKEVKTEQMSNLYMNYSNMSNKKDDRRYGGGGSNSSGGNMSFGGGSGGGSGGNSSGYYNKGNRQQNNDDTWYTQTAKGSRVVDAKKLGIITRDIDNETKLGATSQFTWNTGVGNNSLRPTTTTTNSFAALSNLADVNKNSSSGPRNKGSYNKGSMERDRYDGVHSRTGSAHGSRESSSSRNAPSRGSDRNVQKSLSYQNYNSNQQSRNAGQSKPSSTQQASASTSPTSVQTPSGPPPPIFDIPDDKTAADIKSVPGEMVELKMEDTIKECVSVIEKFPVGVRWAILSNILEEYLYYQGTTAVHRKILSEIIIYLLKNNYLSIEQFKKAYKCFCDIAPEIIIDVPEMWQYLFQFIGPLIHKKFITVKELWNNTLKEEKRTGEKFLKELFTYCIREIGPTYTRKMWSESNLKWTDFLDKGDIENFKKKNNFEFIDSKDDIKLVIPPPDINKVMDRVKELLYEGVPNAAIIDYLSGNIAEIDKQFIRSLTKTLCNFAMQYVKNIKLDAQRFQMVCVPLFHRYLDSKEERELECLYAIQVLINSLEHPKGLLSELFGELFDADVIPAESFLKWRESKEEPAGKGVAVVGLKHFFTNLEENGETSDENN